ncbi:MAG: ParA family protein [Deltaproteobacteria bacterium]|nr:ParA family protein [Deltaproteobacteria bacterium]
MTTTIVFASEKGGVGKTTSAVNLAMAFVVGGYKVLLIDMDPQGSVRFSFGIKGPVKLGTRQLLLDPSVPVDKLIYPGNGSGMDYIFANIDTLDEEKELSAVMNDPYALQRRIVSEGQRYDFIILDAPASTSLLTINALTAADLVILPLQCESLAMKSLKRFLLAFKTLQRKVNPGLRIAGILLTMYDRSLEVHRRISREVYDTLQDSVFQTIIPKVKEITEASALGQSVITYSINSVGATAYIRLSKEILDRFGLRPDNGRR